MKMVILHPNSFQFSQTSKERGKGDVFVEDSKTMPLKKKHELMNIWYASPIGWPQMSDSHSDGFVSEAWYERNLSAHASAINNFSRVDFHSGILSLKHCCLMHFPLLFWWCWSHSEPHFLTLPISQCRIIHAFSHAMVLFLHSGVPLSKPSIMWHPCKGWTLFNLQTHWILCYVSYMLWYNAALGQIQESQCSLSPHV